MDDITQNPGEHIVVDARARTLYGVCSLVGPTVLWGMLLSLVIPAASGGPIMHAVVQHTGTAQTPNESIVVEALTKTTQVLVQVASTLLS